MIGIKMVSLRDIGEPEIRGVSLISEFLLALGQTTRLNEYFAVCRRKLGFMPGGIVVANAFKEAFEIIRGG